MTKSNQKANAALEKKIRIAITELDEEGRIAGLQEALRAQATTIAKEDEPSTVSEEIEQMLMFADDVAEHAPGGGDEEGAIEKARPGKPARRIHRDEVQETGDLPGISSPEVSRDHGSSV